MRVPCSTIEEALEPLLDLLADKIGDKIVARLAAGSRPDMVDQAGSPLGRRRHIAAARARVGRGDAGAAVVGRRHLLTRAALEEELQLLAKRKPRKQSPRDELAAARERYGLQRGAA